tara:strand:- start:782 stop:1327 length:546 start_codon:yes stop_codon:yes gene_type:complete
MIKMKLEGTQMFSTELRNIGLSMQDKKKLIKEVILPSAKIVRKTMREAAPKLEGAPSFNVYRTPKISGKMKAPKGMGVIYAKIKPGQLKKSVGIIRTSATRKYPALNIGPRYKKGVWVNPEKGGWYMHMVQFGTPTTIAKPFVLQSFIAVESLVKRLLENDTLKMLKRMVRKHGHNHFKII